MTNHTLLFRARRQELVLTNEFCRFASNTMNYVYARFDLDEDWQSFDAVKAVWQNDACKIAQIILHDTDIAVPVEMLSRRSVVAVNLVGYDVEDDQMTERLTTYPAKALVVDKTAIVEGEESNGVSPSLFEQYIEIVSEEVSSVINMTVSSHVDDSVSVTKTESGGVINLDFGLVPGESNVQADWNEGNDGSDAYIKNKPTIPVVPTNVSSFTNDAGYLTLATLPTYDGGVS